MTKISRKRNGGAHKSFVFLLGFAREFMNMLDELRVIIDVIILENA